MSLPLMFVSWGLILLTLLLAIRLTRGAIRNREMPEGLMAAFFIGGAGGYLLLMVPLTIGLDKQTAELIMRFSSALLMTPVAAVAMFTWTVFRPNSIWARNLALMIGVSAVATHAMGVWLAEPLGLTQVFSSTPGSAFYWVSRAIHASGFGWAAFEASLYYVKARRRVALGLLDAVVANRFLLWAVWSGSATTMVAVRTLATLTAAPGSVEPQVWVSVALLTAGAICGASVWLTFAPPSFYTRLIGGANPAS